MTDFKTNLAVMRPELIYHVKKIIEEAGGKCWIDQLSELSEESLGLMQEAIYNRVVDAIIERLLEGDEECQP